MCGPSAAQTAISQQQQAFYKNLQNVFQQQFGENQQIFGEISKSLTPIVEAGINQFGFSPEETAALRTQATDVAAAGYQQETKALGEGLAGRGGGNEFIPSGAAEQLQGGLALGTERGLANQQLGITEAGYEQGRRNYLAATGILSGLPAETSAGLSGLAGAATGAGSAAASEANKIQQGGQSWLGILGGVAGAAAGAFTGGIVPGILGGIGSFTGPGGGQEVSGGYPETNAPGYEEGGDTYG